MTSRGRPLQPKLDEVCRKFLKGRCFDGPRCHRRHPHEEVSSQAGDDDRSPDKEKNSTAAVAGSGKETSALHFPQRNRLPPSAPLPAYTGDMKLHVVKLPPPRHPPATSCAPNCVVASKESFDHWDPGTRSWAWRDESDSWAHDSQSSSLSSPESSSASSFNVPTVSSQSSISPSCAARTVTNDYRRDRTPGICIDWRRGRCIRDRCKFRHVDGIDHKYVAISKENIAELPLGDRDCLRCTLQICDGRHEGNGVDHSHRERSDTKGPSVNSAPLSQLRSVESPAVYNPPQTTPPRKYPYKRSIPPRMIDSSSMRPHPPPPPPPPPPPESLTITVLDHTKVKFGPGFQVRDVTTGFESRWVVLGNIPSCVTAAEITGILEPFGTVASVKLPEHIGSSSMTVKAQFFHSTEAMQATTLLNGAQVFNQTISVRLSVNNTRNGNATLRDTSVRIQWDAPGRLGFAGYSSLSEAQAAILNANKAPLRGSYITATLYEGLPAIDAYNVRFHLPPDAEEKDVEMFGHSEGVMLQQPNYRSLENAVNRIRGMLEELGELTFEVLPPPHNGLVKAWANFSSPPVAMAASDYLNGRRLPFIGKKKVWVRHVQTLSYALPANVYSRVATDVERLRELCWKRGPATFVTVDRRKQAFDPTCPVLIKLWGETTRDLSRLKTELEVYLRGEPVRQDGKVVWDDFFGRPAGATFLSELERRYPGASVETDIPRRSIALFGPAGRRASARDAILEKLTDLRGQQIRTIPLAGRVIGFFMSAELMKLQDELGHENVIIHLLDRTLTIRGNDVAYEAALQAVHNAQGRHCIERCRKAVECPVCFNEVSSPITLHCGHSWCRPCLSSYLTAASDNKLFPLTCLGNEAKCSQLISLTIAQEILSASEFEDLTNASFLAYVHSRPGEFHYCPTPDCAQIYRTAPQDTVLQCPSCLIRICPSCHVEYHDGQECADRQNGGEKLFRDWSKLHDVKNCPGCKAPIEKSDGCNHMTCIRCQTHICWVCMKTFPKGEKIYKHMREEHGGIGL